MLTSALNNSKNWPFHAGLRPHSGITILSKRLLKPADVFYCNLMPVERYNFIPFRKLKAMEEDVNILQKKTEHQ